MVSWNDCSNNTICRNQTICLIMRYFTYTLEIMSYIYNTRPSDSMLLLCTQVAMFHCLLLHLWYVCITVYYANVQPRSTKYSREAAPTMVRKPAILVFRTRSTWVYWHRTWTLLRMVYWKKNLLNNPYFVHILEILEHKTIVCSPQCKTGLRFLIYCSPFWIVIK